MSWHARRGAMPSILLVTSVYPPAIGGPSLQTREIALALAARGWTTTVLAPRAERGPSPARDVPLVEIEGGDRQRRGWVSRNTALFRAIDGAVGRVRPDLVHVQVCEGNFPLYAGIAARRRRLPCLVKFSADFVWNRLNRDRYLGIPYEQIHTSSLRARALTAAQRMTFAQYDLVWATSPFQHHALTTTYRIEPERVRLLPNLVSTAESTGIGPRTSALTGMLTALVVARIVPWKGIDDCITCLRFPGMENVLLRIVGDGSPEYRAELERLSVRLGVAERVHFAGSVDPTRVGNEFVNADILVLASRYEPFGIVLVQAMSAGLPVVATRIGGIPSIVDDGETGLLVPPDSPEALACAIARLARDPDLRTRLGQAGNARCGRFSIEERIGDLVAIYEQLPRRRADRTSKRIQRCL